MTPPKAFIIFSLLLISYRPAFAQVSLHYTVTDLGSLGGQECAATAINNQGQIVGGADTARHGKGPEFVTNVFVWQNRRMRGVPGLDGSHAYVVAVNDAGQMAGAYSPDPLKAQFAAAQFTFTGKVKLLGGFPVTVHGFSLSQGEAINAKGQVVGISNNQAFFWDKGHLRKLLPPPGLQSSDARAMNDKGQAAGKADRTVAGVTRSHGVFWDTNGKARDLGRSARLHRQRRAGDQ